jgi:hypothetical protein
MLIASELATNAVVHAQSNFAVSLDRIRGGVVLAVSDDDSSAPSLDSPPKVAVCGHGMNFVRTPSKACGVRQIPDDGKTVWAALRAKPEPQAH